MKLFIWTDECNYTAFAHCDTVAEARDLLRPQIGGYDGSCPEREKASKYVEDFTPAVYNGRVADFRLSASAEEREAMEYADKLSLQVTDLRAQLKASQADVKLLREALEDVLASTTKQVGICGALDRAAAALTATAPKEEQKGTK